MVLPDVNVLVYAHRADSTQHAGCRDWMESVINGDEAYGPSTIARKLVVLANAILRPKQIPTNWLDDTAASEATALHTMGFWRL